MRSADILKSSITDDIRHLGGLATELAEIAGVGDVDKVVHASGDLMAEILKIIGKSHAAHMLELHGE